MTDKNIKEKNMSVEKLIKRKEEIEKQFKSTEANLNAIMGALQLLDQLIKEESDESNNE